MSYQSALSPIEEQEAEYIQYHGECMVETVIDTWLDRVPKSLDTIELRNKLTEVLKAQWSDREIAEAVSVSGGGPTFDEFLDNQE